MKSKAKRNNNRPASFREKCRNAFAGAIKGLANINAAEKENVAASFDLDKRSVERRIDAIEKNRAVAKRIAEGCIKGDPSFNFDDEWIAINILMNPPYNVLLFFGSGYLDSRRDSCKSEDGRGAGTPSERQR